MSMSTGCQIYEGGSWVSEEECKRLTDQKIAAQEAGVPPPTFLDHPSVANLPPEAKQAILARHQKDYPDNTLLYLGGAVVILLVWKFVF